MKWSDKKACLWSGIGRLTLSCLLFFTSVGLFAETTPPLVFSTVRGIEISNPSAFIDSSHLLNFSNYMMASPFSGATNQKKGGLVNVPVWISFSLRNTTDHTLKIILEPPLADSLFFLLKHKTSDTLKISGRYIYNPNHLMNTQRRTTEAYLIAREEVKVVIKIVSSFKPIPLQNLYVVVKTEEDFLKDSTYALFKARNTVTIAVVFLSMLLFQLLFISVQGLFTRRIDYLYYLLYAFCIGLYYLSKYEISLNWNIFFTYFPSLNLIRSNFLLYIPYFFYYRFARHYCDIERRDHKLAGKIKMAELGVLLYCILLILCIYVKVSPVAFQVILFFGLVSLLIVSVYFIYKVYLLKNLLSRILVTGSVIALFTSLIANFSTYSNWLYNLIPVTPLELTMIGVIAEMIIFNAGLVFKARLLEREQRIIQEKLHKEAEERRRLILQNIAERDRIAADLHDDIGATLSSISIYSDSAAQKLRLGDHQRAGKLLEQIGTNARSTMNNMSDIVWAINPVYDDNRHLIDRMESFANTLLQSKGIAFDFNSSKVNPATELPPGARKGIFMIFKEAINNSVKYSGATLIKVELDESSADWKITISDNGTGFNVEEVKKGNGLRNMRNRARESGGEMVIISNTEGTSIALKIPK